MRRERSDRSKASLAAGRVGEPRRVRRRLPSGCRMEWQPTQRAGVGEFPTARLRSTAVNALQDAPLLPGVWFSPPLRKDRRSWNDRATMRIDKVPRDRHVGLANRESGPLTWVAKTRRKRAIEKPARSSAGQAGFGMATRRCSYRITWETAARCPLGRPDPIPCTRLPVLLGRSDDLLTISIDKVRFLNIR